MKKQIALILMSIIPISLLADTRTSELEYIQAKKHFIGIFWDGGDCIRAPIGTAASDSATGAGVFVGAVGQLVSCNFTDEELDNKILSPVAVFFNRKTGVIKKDISFFDDICPYKPLSVLVKGNEITMLAGNFSNGLSDANALNEGTGQNIAGLGVSTSNVTSPFYPDCDFETFNNKTYVEVRKLNNGKLIRNFILDNVDDYFNQND